jgi:hypothetical protein
MSRIKLSAGDDRTGLKNRGLWWWTLLVIGSGAEGPCCQDGRLTLGWQTSSQDVRDDMGVRSI